MSRYCSSVALSSAGKYALSATLMSTEVNDRVSFDVDLCEYAADPMTGRANRYTEGATEDRQRT